MGNPRDYPACNVECNLQVHGKADRQMISKEIFNLSKLKENFQNSMKFSKNIFQGNFLQEVQRNFLAGTEAINKLIVGDELYEKTKEGPTEFTEGGIRIQENSPKSGGREETKTK